MFVDIINKQKGQYSVRDVCGCN